MIDHANPKPFWDIIPQFFLVPLKGAGIIALILLAFLATYFDSILVWVLLVFIVIKYGTAILDNTAEGRLESPALTTDVLNKNYQLPFKQLILFLLPTLLLLAPIFLRLDGFVSAIIIANLVIFYSIALPASVMTLAYTQSFLSAINPLFLSDLIGRIGWSYLILCAFLWILNGGASTAYYIFMGDNASDKALFIFILLQIYFAWIMYAMTGYILYQYHEDIGYEPPDRTTRKQREKQVQDVVTDLTLFNQSIAEENYQMAQDILKAILIEDPNNLALRKKFHKVTKLSGDNKQLTLHAKGLIARLIAKNQLSDAQVFYQDCIEVDAEFSLAEAEHYLPLAKQMRTTRHYKQAISLLSGFHKQYPNCKDIPYAYLLVIQIFMEDLSLNDKAKPVLEYLKNNYADHDVAAAVERYINLLS